MAKQTLTVQLMHAQKRIAELEEQLAALKTVAPARAIEIVADRRKAAIKEFFKQNPGHRSVSHAQLVELGYLEAA